MTNAGTIEGSVLGNWSPSKTLTGQSEEQTAMTIAFTSFPICAAKFQPGLKICGFLQGEASRILVFNLRFLKMRLNKGKSCSVPQLTNAAVGVLQAWPCGAALCAGSREAPRPQQETHLL